MINYNFFAAFLLLKSLLFQSLLSECSEGNLGWRGAMRAHLSVFAQFLSAFITIR